MNTSENSPMAATRLGRIKAVSRVLRNILFAGLIAQGIGILALVVAIATATLTRVGSQAVFENYAALATLPFIFMLTFNLLRFFDQLNKGCLFDLPTVKYLQMAGRWWLVGGIVQVTFQSLKAYFFSAKNIMISGDGIIAGLVIIFIAWILDEARKIQEEQELTV